MVFPAPVARFRDSRPRRTKASVPAPEGPAEATIPRRKKDKIDPGQFSRTFSTIPRRTAKAMSGERGAVSPEEDRLAAHKIPLHIAILQRIISLHYALANPALFRLAPYPFPANNTSAPGPLCNRFSSAPADTIHSKYKWQPAPEPT